MEVILRNAIDKLGHPGDVVTVSAGYARNFLLPRGLAYQATPGNLKRIAQEKSRLEALEAERVAAAQKIAEQLAEVSVTFAALAGLLWLDPYPAEPLLSLGAMLAGAGTAWLITCVVVRADIISALASVGMAGKAHQDAAPA